MTPPALRRLGVLLLLGMAGLTLRNLQVSYREHEEIREAHRVEFRPPVSMAERSRSAPYKSTQQRFAFFYESGRFRGARVLLSRDLRRHAWFLERVGDVRVTVARRPLRIPEELAQRLQERAAFEGVLDGRVVYFIPGGRAYALVATGDQGPLFWVPEQDVVGQLGRAERTEAEER